MQTFRMPQLWEFAYMFLLALSLIGITWWVADLQLRKKIEEPWATYLHWAVSAVVFVSGLMLYEILCL